MKVLLITGGNSSEREVSLLSAQNVMKVLIKNKHTVLLYDLQKGYEKINDLVKDYDVLFPMLHGEEGEGGKLHEFLNKIDKPIVGTRNYKGLREAWFKIPFKKYCDENGVRTASWKIIKTKADVLKFGLPCVLKASNGGSSKEVIILTSPEELSSEACKNLLNTDDLFVEKLIGGVEVTVGTLNENVLPIIEIVPTKHAWFSYDAKYDTTTKEILFAPSINHEIQKRLKKVTKKIRNDFNLGSYIRIDYIVTTNGDIYALDVNTIVGLTAGSLYPKMAKAAGLNFNELIEQLLKSAR